MPTQNVRHVLAEVVRGRSFVFLSPRMLSAALLAHKLGARCLVLGHGDHYPGIPKSDDFQIVNLDPNFDLGPEAIAFFDPDSIESHIRRFDPHGDAVLIGNSYFAHPPELFKRPVWGARTSTSLKIENKAVGSRILEQAGAAEHKSILVNSADMDAVRDSHARMSQSTGTSVISGNTSLNEVTMNGKAVRFVSSNSDPYAEIRDLLDQYESVCVSEFLNGLPSSAQALILPDGAISYFGVREQCMYFKPDRQSIYMHGMSNVWRPPHKTSQHFTKSVHNIGELLAQDFDYRGPFSSDAITMLTPSFHEINARRSLGFSYIGKAEPYISLLSAFSISSNEVWTGKTKPRIDAIELSRAVRKEIDAAPYVSHFVLPLPDDTNPKLREIAIRTRIKWLGTTSSKHNLNPTAIASIKRIHNGDGGIQHRLVVKPNPKSFNGMPAAPFLPLLIKQACRNLNLDIDTQTIKPQVHSSVMPVLVRSGALASLLAAHSDNLSPSNEYSRPLPGFALDM